MPFGHSGDLDFKEFSCIILMDRVWPIDVAAP
jgi:hypothetical protein